MNRTEISNFLSNAGRTKDRNIVIVDFANVDNWRDSLDWPVSIKKLAQLVKHISYGKKPLRRFYYGEDYGPKDKNDKLTPWSQTITDSAKYNNFEIISKRVKYIPDPNYTPSGLIKKCNLDIEMAVDLIVEKDNYDTAFIFSGDGDLAYVINYLNKEFDKKFFIFVARDHLGKELIDAQKEGLIEKILFVEDFEYRLNLHNR